MIEYENEITDSTFIWFIKGFIDDFYIDFHENYLSSLNLLLHQDRFTHVPCISNLIIIDTVESLFLKNQRFSTPGCKDKDYKHRICGRCSVRSFTCITQLSKSTFCIMIKILEKNKILN